VVNNILDPNNRDEYIQDIKNEYEEIRKEYYEGQKERHFVSLAKARSKRLQIDWRSQVIVRPSFLGVKVFEDYDLASLVPFFDWDPFFQSW
jgi:5-methyltetrahydrofolate--homocysteine methyltransferase